MARGEMPKGRGAAMMRGPRGKVNKGTFKRVLKYITKGHKLQLAIVVICIIVSSLANVRGTLFLRTLIDDYITPLLNTPNPVFDGLLKAIATLGCMYLVGIVSTYVYNRIMAVVSQSVLKDIRDDMFDKMEELPIKYFDTHTHGEIMSHYTNDTDTLRQMISQSLPNFVSSTMSIVSTFVSMLILSPILTIFVVVFTSLIMFITSSFVKISSKYFVSQQKSLATVNGYVEEMISGQKVIKVFTHEGKAIEEFDKLNDQLFTDMYTANKYANNMMPIAGNLGNLEYVLVALTGTVMAINGIGGLTPGTIVSFLNFTKGFNMPIQQMTNQLNSVIMALAGASRIFEMMDEKPEEDKGYVTLVNAKRVNGELVECEEKTGIWAWKHPHHDGTLDYVEVKGHIEFVDVDFGYEPNKTVLHNVSVYAKPGQKIAFVGATGAGKTTIMNLINRFYDIEDGKIRYDGININKIKKDDLRKSLGMVLQDTNLFTGTIRDNIKYGCEDATDEQVIEAAKLANAHNFIMHLPDGYDTMLTNNGAQLSQGQRQLLAIARAAINDPPVMILDEATSSIDTRTEKIVQEGMDKLMEGRTVFVIAHRLSTVRDSKAIMVLDHGRIIERGSHDELIAAKGQYYQLYTGAFELE
ncbi:MAG: ABC transporter ATP-binding protein [Clostridia bacterium]|nr:ABC transporter ATP-binding protein [Clostridia bacterium]